MNRFLRFTPEATFGTFASASTAKVYVPLDGSNGFKPLIQRPVWGIRHPAKNVPWLRGTEVYSLSGQWTDRHYWEHPDVLLWVNRVIGADDFPWENNQRDGDGASATIEYAYSEFDGTLDRHRYTGMKIGESWEASVKNDPANPFLNFNYSLLGSIALPNPVSGGTAPDSTAFPAPACESDYPAEPLTFWQMAFTYEGNTMEFFDSITIRGRNVVTTHFDSKRYVNRIHHHGRTVTLTARMRLEFSNDPRAVYEAQTALGDCRITFTRPSPADVISIDFRDEARVESIDEEHPIDADGYTTVTATAHLDCGDGDDFKITYTPAA